MSSSSMSSLQSRNFHRAERPPSIHNSFTVDGGTIFQTPGLQQTPPQLPRKVMETGNPQPRYPAFNTNDAGETRQIHHPKPYNDAQLKVPGMPATSVQTKQQSHPLSPPSPASQTHSEYRAYDSVHFAGNQMDRAAASYDMPNYQNQPSPSMNPLQRYSPQPPQSQYSDQSSLPYPSPPQQPSSMYHAPPHTQDQRMQFSAPGIGNPPVQHRPPLISGREPITPNTPYGSSPHNDTLSPQQGVMRSPLPRMSPASMQHELEKTKEYAENILTSLMETQKLLDERDAEIARLKGEIARSGRNPYQQDNTNNWELQELRRKLYDQDQALRNAQEEAARAHSLAQFQHKQAETYSQQLFQLKETHEQSQKQQKDTGQLDEAHRVTDFYKKQVDQLSRENISVNQQNRKLIEDLAVVQREVQQQRSLVDSLR